MAILNLAGNFQPNSVTDGRNLPLLPTRAPSASGSLDKSSLAAAALKSAAETKATSVDKVETVEKKQVAPPKEEVKNQIEDIIRFNQNIDRSLQFSVDEELGVTIVRVIDKETDELIRQFPPEELINLSRRLKELNEQHSSQSGVLLQEKV